LITAKNTLKIDNHTDLRIQLNVLLPMSQRILPITDIDTMHKYLEVDKKDLSAKPQDARRAIGVHDRCD